MLKRFIQILALATSLTLVACNGSSTSITSSGGTENTTTTSASYAGTYTGTTTGINSGPTNMVIAADKSVSGTFSITNRLTNETGTGVPTVYETTLVGTVDSAGKVTVNSFMDGALVMIFTGQINSSGGLSGTYYEFSDVNKGGSFSLQGPANGSTTTSAGGSAKSCTGSFVGTYDMPEQSERIRVRNLSLIANGKQVTGNDAIDNAEAGGGGPDGGIYMQGSYAFETDANCNIVKGTTMVFYAYQYDISGAIAKSGESNLTWSGQGSVGELKLSVNANNAITGNFYHPAPDSFVYGVISGTFTPNGKI